MSDFSDDARSEHELSMAPPPDERPVGRVRIECPTCHAAEEGCQRCDGNGWIKVECQCVLRPVIAADRLIHDPLVGR